MLFTTAGENWKLKIQNEQLQESTSLLEANFYQKNALFEELAKSEKTMRMLGDNLPKGVIFQIIINQENKVRRFNYISDKISDLTGIAFYDFVQNPNLMRRRIHKNDFRTVTKAMKDTVTKDTVIDIEIRYFKKHDDMRWFNINAFSNFSGDDIIINGFLIDITEKKQYEEQLNSLNNLLEDKVEERTFELEEAHKKVAGALKREQELNRMKTMFIMMVSHEYRTPLTEILASAELIKRFAELDKTDDIKTFVQKISNAVFKMTKLIDDVMTVEKCLSLGLTIRPYKFNVVKKTEEIIEEERKKDNNMHEFHFNPDPPECFIYSDPIIFSKIISNLLSNAVKYSLNNTIVNISLKESNEYIELRVEDQGTGISEPDLKELFTMFYKTKDSIGIKPGLGVGMSIIKCSVDTLDGEIMVDSQINVGTTFTVKLPKTLN